MFQPRFEHAQTTGPVEAAPAVADTSGPTEAAARSQEGKVAAQHECVLTRSSFLAVAMPVLPGSAKRHIL